MTPPGETRDAPPSNLFAIIRPCDAKSTLAFLNSVRIPAHKFRRHRRLGAIENAIESGDTAGQPSLDEIGSERPQHQITKASYGDRYKERHPQHEHRHLLDKTTICEIEGHRVSPRD
jgi:hypothetical protein